MKIFLNFFTIFLFLFFSTKSVYAVTTTLTQSPSLISQDPFAITISITGAKAGKNYLRVDLYKEGSTEYSGETYNGQEWYSGEDGTKYAPIDIISSETQLATISARLTSFPPNWSSSNSFFIRIRRYTASGGYTSSEAETSAIPIAIQFPTHTPSPSPTNTPSPIPTPTTKVIIDNIFITEALTTPESGQQEWVELYNNNDFAITLDSWLIDDIENAGSNPQTFTLSINAKSYATIDLQSSIFNNEGDSVRLLDSKKQQKDHFAYSQTQLGKSISRNVLDSRDVCITQTTKNEANASCIPLSTNIINIISPTPHELIYENGNDDASILGIDSEITESLNQISPTASITYFQGIGHDYNNIHPSDYQDEPIRSAQFQPTIFQRPIWTGLVRSGTASAVGISILNIMFILYRMNLWRPHFRSKIFSFTGFP